MPDRFVDTLKPLLAQYILRGTHIISDGWRLYHNIDVPNNGVHSHLVIIHDAYFVHSVFQTCTRMTWRSCGCE
ncbi:unnamed protein product [Anisakis simplex]|uniref:DDE_Tnp_IS1595 domain-containing protein n=1 Tax=Anisakis simplex TaxID=6269 RepID=A0A0M3K7R0_ANISI|nr:unnamed protein product [Anisakis simplex]